MFVKAKRVYKGACRTRDSRTRAQEMTPSIAGGRVCGGARACVRCRMLCIVLFAMVACDVRDVDQPWNLDETRDFRPVGFDPPACAAPTGALSFVLPLGVARSAVALGACASLTVGNGATVREASDSAGGDAEAFVVLVSAGSARVGHGARVPSIYVLGREPLRLGPDAAVYGFIKASAGLEWAPSATVDIDVMGAAERDCERRSWAIPFLKGAVHDVHTRVTDSSPVRLEPGPYGRMLVEARSALVLRSGQYVMDALDVEPQGVLEIDNTRGPVWLWVRSALALRGEMWTYFAGLNVLFGYAGTAAPDLAGPFRGTLVVPNASLRLPATPRPHVGSFFARDIDLAPGAMVEHAPLASPDLVPPTPEAVCSECGRSMRAASSDCRDAAARAASVLRSLDRACLAGCPAIDGALAPACLDACQANDIPKVQAAQTASEQCLRVAGSACGDSERKYAYWPGVCRALGYGQPRAP